ncbi:TniQ family protein [Burkholderia cenocepacia]|uniref:TniQ family protein n=1 Tax=Burkholderia cenocepacia TaxID=95486 RepID=UPI001F2EEDF1|nr:TniQ family protein [Burkholderia cenocepacia]MCF1369329.1 TniQ family protein [Burkholderia cenocepacia]MCF1386640.1 TniQ family protein [Burkholderia cenocepacia]
MSVQQTTPRSMLNPLTPIGIGTPEVESLFSYFCRLAMSHSISAAELSRKVATTMGWEIAGRYDWNDVNLSGLADAAADWSSALAVLTSVERLDKLTLLTWRNVIAQQSLPATSPRWCPLCLAEDRAAGRIPYFRLAWDINAVTACHRHKTKLVHVCPECSRADARHNSAYVIPGWCAHSGCGVFLGNLENPAPATAEATWIATQVGAILTAQATLDELPARQVLHDTIRQLVARLDNGKGAIFARRIGVSKVTVHCWLKKDGTPSLPAHLRIASQTGLTLSKLLIGDITEWPSASTETQPLASLFPDHKKRASPRILEWGNIRAELTALSELPVPISVMEAARRLGVTKRQLYGNANGEARVLAERRRQYIQQRIAQNRETARAAIEVACRDIVASGKAPHLRELKGRVPQEVLGGLRDVIGLLQEAKSKREAS